MQAMAAGGGSVTASQAAAAAVRVVEEGDDADGGGAGAQLDEFGRDVGLQKRYVLALTSITQPASIQ